MPELPEVETVRRGLEPVLVGATFQRVEQRRPDLRFPFPAPPPPRGPPPPPPPAPPRPPPPASRSWSGAPSTSQPVSTMA